MSRAHGMHCICSFCMTRRALDDQTNFRGEIYLNVSVVVPGSNEFGSTTPEVLTVLIKMKYRVNSSVVGPNHHMEPEPHRSFNEMNHYNTTLQYQPPEPPSFSDEMSYYNTTLQYQPPEPPSFSDEMSHYNTTLQYQPPEPPSFSDEMSHYNTTLQYQPPEPPSFSDEMSHYSTPPTPQHQPTEPPSFSDEIQPQSLIPIAWTPHEADPILHIEDGVVRQITRNTIWTPIQIDSVEAFLGWLAVMSHYYTTLQHQPTEPPSFSDEMVGDMNLPPEMRQPVEELVPQFPVMVSDMNLPPEMRQPVEELVPQFPVNFSDTYRNYQYEEESQEFQQFPPDVQQSIRDHYYYEMPIPTGWTPVDMRLVENAYEVTLVNDDGETYQTMTFYPENQNDDGESNQNSQSLPENQNDDGESYESSQSLTENQNDDGESYESSQSLTENQYDDGESYESSQSLTENQNDDGESYESSQSLPENQGQENPENQEMDYE